jgi:hypothetical protein
VLGRALARVLLVRPAVRRSLHLGGRLGTARQGPASGKLRYEQRIEWWDEYATSPLCVSNSPLCVFGHYSKIGYEPPRTRAVCIDFAIGKRSQERLKGSGIPFQTRLGALRFPSEQ